MDDQLKIQNLNQMLSHVAGRLDVLHQMLNTPTENPADVLSRARRFVNKGHDNLEKMMTRHANGERCVE